MNINFERRGSPLALTVSVALLSGVVTLQAAPATLPTPSAAVSVGGVLDGVRVYPNPWRSDKHPDKPISFDHLPVAATIKIFTVAGAFVKTLESSDTGTATWDLTTDSGDKAASGLYLYLITTDDGQEIKGKLALMR